jgi:8-oxo-dGTP pyrophosphatase MutT (NUDIX family)
VTGVSDRFVRLRDHLAGRVPRTEDGSSRPRAAVALILAPEPDSILLIRRAERDGDVWSGHLAFPGGRAAPGDADLMVTAMRETREEVGVPLDPSNLLGQLDDLAPSSPVLPPILVRPFVFFIPKQTNLSPNPEVAAAFWLPLSELSRPGVLRPTEHRRHGTLVRLTGYHLEQGVLWGMTERILTPFLELVGNRE